MIAIDCAREDETRAALACWPDGCADELRTHVEDCAICASIVEIGALMREALRVEQQQARVPAAQLVWRRAQLRAQHEATHAAAAPITFVQAAAIAGGATGGLALVLATWPWLQSRMASVVDRAASVAEGAASLDVVTIALRVGGALVPPGAEITILLAIAAWLVLAPAAIYLAVSDD